MRTVLTWLSAASLRISISLALLAAGCAQEGAPGTPIAPQDSGYFTATTDARGVGVLRNEEGETLLEVEARDSLGAPLAGLDLSYLAAAPYPLLAFNVAASGDPAGTFLLVPLAPAAPAQARVFARLGADSAGGEDHAVAVFILDLVDVTSGRLYDPARDGFSAARCTNIAEIRRVLGLDMILLVLQSAPGIEDLGVVTRGSIMAGSFGTENVSIYARWMEAGAHPEDQALAHRIARLAAFMQGQDDSYRYHLFSDPRAEHRFCIPLGVSAGVTFDAPALGETFVGPAQRRQALAGRIACPPDIITADGGRVELHGNGSLVSDALSVGGDGTGRGSTFTTVPLQLAVGENALRVSVYVSAVNRGLENGEDGWAGEGTVTLHYAEEVAPRAPSLTGMSCPATAPCPQGTVVVAFHFSDPDGDVLTVHERMSGRIQGQPASHEGSAPVANLPALACLLGTEADCEISLPYGGLYGGDWLNYEFWVVDATGLESEHLRAHVDIVGDCAGLGSGTGASPPTGLSR